MMFFSCGKLQRHNLLILHDTYKGHFQEMPFMQRRFVR